MLSLPFNRNNLLRLQGDTHYCALRKRKGDSTPKMYQILQVSILSQYLPYLHSPNYLVTARNEVRARLCFYRCV